MTIRETLQSAVESLSDDETARVLGYVEAVTEARVHTNGSRAAKPRAGEDEYDDELTHAEPKLGLSPESSIWRLAGFIKDDGPTDMASDKYKYFPQVYAHSTGE